MNKNEDALKQNEHLKFNVCRLEDLAGEMLFFSKTIAKKTKELEELQKKYDTFCKYIIPDLMDELQLKKITLTNGMTISVIDDIACSIKQEKQEEAFKWLNNNNLNIVKKGVYFGCDQESATKVLDFMEENEILGVIDQKVHSATLKATIKEELAKGKDVPFDLFGIISYKKTIIKE